MALSRVNGGTCLTVDVLNGSSVISVPANQFAFEGEWLTISGLTDWLIVNCFTSRLLLE